MAPSASKQKRLAEKAAKTNAKKGGYAGSGAFPSLPSPFPLLELTHHRLLLPLTRIILQPSFSLTHLFAILDHLLNANARARPRAHPKTFSTASCSLGALDGTDSVAGTPLGSTPLGGSKNVSQEDVTTSMAKLNLATDR
jgi:hypothetical protein